jgi:hypothetical protein
MKSKKNNNKNTTGEYSGEMKILGLLKIFVPCPLLIDRHPFLHSKINKKKDNMANYSRFISNNNCKSENN